MKAYQKLKTVFSQLGHLDYINRIMIWDEATMMPEGAGTARAEALATFNTITHKILCARKNKALIEAAKQENNLSPWDKVNLQLMEKKYLKAACISTNLTEKFIKAALASQQAWRTLRAQNNWNAFFPYFKTVYKLRKEIAQRHADVLQLSVYDVLIDEYAPGFNQATIDDIFSGLKQTLPDLIKTIIQKQSNEFVKVPIGPFPIEQQKQLGHEVMKILQFDFQHGRLDVSHHPCCNGNSADVRITTRYKEQEIISSLLAICHETGHALYEQGLPSAWYGQLVGNVRNMAMHESQSLLIEKQVCSSLPFFEYLTPVIQKIFGYQAAFTAENLYRYTAQVKPNLIRVDADELSYQLHIILRYEMEKDLFNGDLSIEYFPAYWDTLMFKYLTIKSKDNKDGVMQDIHWPAGSFGYFPAYSLGRLIAAQLFETFIKTQPTFFESLKQGNFQPLKNWLQENIYSYGQFLTTQDLLIKITGRSLDPTSFINYIKQKYLNSPGLVQI